MHLIYKNIENRKYTSAIFIDFSKAYDKVNHELLLKKLKTLQFSDSFFNLLQTYFSNRKQFVEIDKIKSKILKLFGSIGQGTATGCSFFNFYVNSIFALKLHGKILLYADDCAIVYGENDLDTLKRKMEEDLETILKWCKTHFLEMNLNKTNFILFHPRFNVKQNAFKEFNITFNNVQLSRVQSTCYLGLTIDEKLSWSEHIKQIKRKISPMIFALRNIRRYLSEESCLKIYYSHIYSHLIYMNPLWNMTTQENIKQLEVMQKKCLRTIYRKPLDCSINDIFNIKTIPLKVLNDYNLLILAFKVNHNLIINNISIQRISDIHTYNTRRINDFYVYRYSTDSYGLADFFTRGLIKFNELNDSEKSIQSLSEFKKVIKINLLRAFLSGDD